MSIPLTSFGTRHKADRGFALFLFRSVSSAVAISGGSIKARPLPVVVHPLEVRHQEVDERAHLGGDVAPALKCDVDREPRKVPLVQHRDEPSGHQVRARTAHQEVQSRNARCHSLRAEAVASQRKAAHEGQLNTASSPPAIQTSLPSATAGCRPPINSHTVSMCSSNDCSRVNFSGTTNVRSWPTVAGRGTVVSGPEAVVVKKA